MLLSFVLAYYRNPQMLAEQFRVWAGYPATLKAQIEIVLVDDGSPEPASDVPRPDGLPALRIYRVLEDRPWHQHGARNLGAHVAQGSWLFLTDMDHVLPAESLARLIPQLNYDVIYTFHRLNAPDLAPKRDARGALHPHCNTFALSKARYWRVGGYDEDCVGYGTDGFFRKRLYADGPAVLLPDVPIVRYPREVIADASGSAPGIDPKVWRDDARRTTENRTVLQHKAAHGLGPTTLNFPWERVL